MSAASPAASSSTSSAGSPGSSSSHTQLAGSKRKASGKPIDPERAARLEARQARNRASAQISRDRKKAALEGLESELDTLRRDNAALQARAAEAQRLETRVAALENLVRCLLQAGAPPLGSASPLAGLADSLLTPHAIVDPAATLSSLSPSSPAALPLVSEPTASSSLLAHPTSSPATLSTHPTHSLFAAQPAAPAASLPPAESHDSASPSVRLPAADAGVETETAANGSSVASVRSSSSAQGAPAAGAGSAMDDPHPRAPALRRGATEKGDVSLCALSTGGDNGKLGGTSDMDDALIGVVRGSEAPSTMTASTAESSSSKEIKTASSSSGAELFPTLTAPFLPPPSTHEHEALAHSERETDAFLALLGLAPASQDGEAHGEAMQLDILDVDIGFVDEPASRPSRDSGAFIDELLPAELEWSAWERQALAPRAITSA